MESSAVGQEAPACPGFYGFFVYCGVGWLGFFLVRSSKDATLLNPLEAHLRFPHFTNHVSLLPLKKTTIGSDKCHISC